MYNVLNITFAYRQIKLLSSLFICFSVLSQILAWMTFKMLYPGVSEQLISKIEKVANKVKTLKFIDRERTTQNLEETLPP